MMSGSSPRTERQRNGRKKVSAERTQAMLANSLHATNDDLRELFAEAKKVTGERIRDLVVTVPVRSWDAYRAEIRAIATELGVTRLRFVDELTQSQIAERIGVSQMQVSRMLSRILDALRRQMDDRRVEWRRTG